VHLILGEIDGCVLEYLFSLVKILFLYILFQFTCWFLILLILVLLLTWHFGMAFLACGYLWIWGCGDWLLDPIGVYGGAFG
jgi:hypothetical protein